MEVKMKRYGAIHYTSDGEEDGCDSTIELVEVPEKILFDTISKIICDEYHVATTIHVKEFLIDFDLVDEVMETMEEKYKEEIEEYIQDNYTIEDLVKNEN